MSRTRLKVCCIAAVGEAEIAIAAGADALGLVAEMPSGPGPIEDAVAAAIVACVPPGVATFLLSARETAAGLAEHAAAVRPTALQIVRHVAPEVLVRLRGLAPGLKLVQVVHVEDEGALALAESYGRLADALLLDSGRPSLAVAELGGTGRVHDWRLSRRIVVRSPVPVYLAGGLDAGNVADAVRAVRPFGVDLCSGVRTGLSLDAGRLGAFVAALGSA